MSYFHQANFLVPEKVVISKLLLFNIFFEGYRLGQLWNVSPTYQGIDRACRLLDNFGLKMMQKELWRQ
jgi:hypothetical protein